MAWYWGGKDSILNSIYSLGEIESRQIVCCVFSCSINMAFFNEVFVICICGKPKKEERFLLREKQRMKT